MGAGAQLATIIAGAVVFSGALAAVARAIFRMAAATDRNTAATAELARKVDQLDTRVDQHEVQLAVLADRRHR